MALKVVHGSGSSTPLSFQERTKRLQELKVISWSSKAPYILAWVAVDSDKEISSYIFRFKFGLMEMGAIVTIRVIFDDAQSGADVVITNMATLPEVMRDQGYGSQALRMLLDQIKKRGVTHIQAVQVQRQSEHFWVKNSFIALKNTTNDFRYMQPSDPDIA